MNEVFEPVILGFTCNWCSYRAADLAGTARVKYPPNVRLIRLMCSGRLDPTFVFKALAEGADGVLITGCHPGDCHYISGNYFARRRFALLGNLLDFVGLEPVRVSFTWVSASEGEQFAEVVRGVTEKVRGLGAQLVNDKGRRFIFDLETRDTVSAAIIRECHGSRVALRLPGTTLGLVRFNFQTAARSHSRDAIRPSLASRSAVSLGRGRRESRVPIAPMGPVQQKHLVGPQV